MSAHDKPTNPAGSNRPDELTRLVLNLVVGAAKDGDTQCLASFGINAVEANHLSQLSAVALERIVQSKESLVGITINREAIGVLSKYRTENVHARQEQIDLIDCLVVAGCTYEILHNHFGTTKDQLSQLRKEHDVTVMGRPRSLSDSEDTEIYIQTQKKESGISLSFHALLVHCLKLHDELDAPFVRIYEAVIEQDQPVVSRRDG